MTFDLKKLPKVTNIKLSNLGFTDIEYIQLESKEQSMISGTDDLLTRNNLVFSERNFILQRFNSILEFRNNGKFITKIGTEGRGPNEFINAQDVDVDNKNHHIYLVSAWQKKFNVYSEQGKFLRTFHCPQNTTNFRITEDGILCYNSNIMGNMDISYNLIDTSGRTIKNFSNRYVWKRVQTSAMLDENLFYRFEKRLFKKEIYSDTVYVFENKAFRPHLVFEHGEKLLTTEARSKYSPEYIFEYYISQKNLFEFGDYIYYEFMYDYKIGGQNILRGLIASKLDNSLVLIDADKGLINDLDGGPNIKLNTIKDDNTIIGWVDVLKLKAHVASEEFKKSTPKYPEKKKELELLANRLKETDNPVLVLVRLKKQ